MITRIHLCNYNYVIALVTLAFSHVALNAQQAVVDYLSNTRQSAQHTDVMVQWAKDVENFNKQFSKLQEHVQIAQQTMQSIGNPSQALQQLGNMGILPQADGLSSTFALAENLQETVDIGKSLQGSGNGFYQGIGSSVQLPDGSSFSRDPTKYKSFAGYEAEKDNHEKVLEDIRAKRKKIMTQIDQLNNTQFTDQSQAQIASVRLQALTAQLNGLNGEEQSANNQRQARAEANINDREKQKEAEAEERKEIEKKALAKQTKAYNNLTRP